ncbi:3'-5' exonuclease [Candidatus Phytoplasma melaleucae]|uniref:ATP-binding domain-containing protein n=1 Tax=Candidatus Phytoplasma melaleucae TaxID=2982630 RepID=A0ABT9DD82_9MOLU|nr:3'-5' exonuclease ['Melaleuca sp.' phytoplasma]MDO8168028.1 ATP-binding domain-containing protein ['Melaleuca sp.' phytoplasma]
MCRLNSAQLQAAHAPAHQALYLRAGAGTGKTKTLIERLLYLAQQVAPAKLLVLASIHQVKGLEFKVVFLLGCEQTTWLNPLLAVVNLAEERRLAYVAVTRAQDQLFLTSVRRRPSLTQPARLKPLTFLKEMGF